MITRALQTYSLLSGYILAVRFKKDGNKSEKEIELSFGEKHFFHLAGLHYLTDIKSFLKGSTQSVYRKLMKDEKLRNRIKKSIYYNDIVERLENIAGFHLALNNMTEIHKYTRPTWTDINGDYVIRIRNQGRSSYYFLICDENGYYVGNSTINDNRQFLTSRKSYKTTYKKYKKKEK